LRDYPALTARHGKYTLQARVDRAVFEHAVLGIEPT